METIQAIKARIASIKSTQQITQSMRLVSTSKVQKAITHMEASMPFYNEALLVMKNLLTAFPDIKSRFVRPLGDSSVGIVAIGSDRGLCGGYNINILKETKKLLEAKGESKVIVVGNQINERFRRDDIPVEMKFNGISESPFYEDANEITDIVMDWFKKGEIGEFYVVQTKYISMINQYTKATKILPFGIAANEEGKKQIYCEPSDEKVIEAVIPMYISAFLYGALAEAAVCEQSSRVTSMDSATRNSNELIEKLTLQYNKARQSAITQELTEIISGANAVEE